MKNPEVSSFIIHKKNMIFSEYFIEKTLENMRFLKKDIKGIWAGVVILCGRKPIHLKNQNQMDFLRNENPRKSQWKP